MSKALIITAAGTSSRFRKSLGRNFLKAIYTEDGKPSILDVLLEYAGEFFEHIVIVGGYQYEALEKLIVNLSSRSNIILVENKQYEKGSNLSLVDGILALPSDVTEAMFVEGDLVIDRDSFEHIAKSTSDIVTHTLLPIYAKTAVAYYVSMDEKIVYMYDTEHVSLTINEPFKAIFNSGQIWKFQDTERLRRIAESFGESDVDLTNLATVERYFSHLPHIEHAEIKRWYNCNTIDDYRNAMDHIEELKQ